MDEQEIMNFVGEELAECEWCRDLKWDDTEPLCEFTVDGRKFEIVCRRAD